ncbi:hypothetical protein ABZU76_34070 [Amycolatopsis sp. NPDC005232]|uniref:hypothetical protein n=1 Tax=Amycolatopsis sp. NPDC005232 TaxID=3157027 RepID=UPI0033B00F4E
MLRLRVFIFLARNAVNTSHIAGCSSASAPARTSRRRLSTSGSFSFAEIAAAITSPILRSMSLSSSSAMASKSPARFSSFCASAAVGKPPRRLGRRFLARSAGNSMR